ncbi:hypothetical protein [Pseudonocardia acidicola]|uniref:4-amino-4-deoxy-L-arabinose transferase-like glycosyltransferase n=1 Tax=Pseudonocardia acidicola TaxID=2724939 RepID=A0ABX1S765_9PSEU|nr:hypothetical protein [Pseudonocardia acidicola]NMH97405.1 hypothetical protein [Pseudonocardia acidicola]
MHATRPEGRERPATAGRTRPGPETHARFLPAAATLLVAVPFIVVAVRSLTANRHVLFAGDQALIGLDVDDAARLDQTVGAYSRYLWAHPGPAWFYLLAPVHQLSGAGSAGLVAATAVVNAVFAGLLVAVVHRRGSPVPTLVVAALVLGFVLRMPAAFFVQVWNPFAVLLPAALLVALGAEAVARAGLCHLLATAVVGSYLLQTHVGTLPLVGLVTLAAALGTWHGARRRGREENRPVHPRRAAVLGGLLVLIWLPPVVQQLTAAPGQGNLRRLAAFFLHPGAGAVGHTPREAVTAVGRMLATAPYGRGPGPLEMDVSVLPGSVIVALLAQAGAAVVLVAAGRRLGQSRVQWTGLLVLVALVAAVAAARTATGPLYWYLIVWAGVLPLCTAIGYADLTAGLLARRWCLVGSSASAPLRRSVAPAVAGGVVAVLVAGASVSLGRATPAVPDSAGVHAAMPLVNVALGDPGGAPAVTLELDDHELWPIAAGVAYDLTGKGYRVLAGPSIGDLFGPHRVMRHPVGPVVVLAAAGAPDGGGRLLGTFGTEITAAELYLRPPG